MVDALAVAKQLVLLAALLYAAALLVGFLPRKEMNIDGGDIRAVIWSYGHKRVHYIRFDLDDKIVERIVIEPWPPFFSNRARMWELNALAGAASQVVLGDRFLRTIKWQAPQAGSFPDFVQDLLAEGRRKIETNRPAA